MEQTFLDVSDDGARSSSSSVKRTVTYETSDLGFKAKGNDITIQHISEAKGYLNEFESMYRKHRADMDSLKRHHASEVGWWLIQMRVCKMSLRSAFKCVHLNSFAKLYNFEFFAVYSARCERSYETCC